MTPLRVLYVEDNDRDAELTMLALRGAGFDVEWTRVETEGDYLRALETPPDVVIADYALPRFSGLRAIELLRQRYPEIPIILVSGTIGEERAAEAIRSGADDYLLKDRMARLPAAVQNVVRAARERAARRRAQTDLHELGQRLKSIVTALPDVIWSIAIPSQEVLYVSPAARKVFGRDPREFYEDSSLWRSLVHPEDRARMSIAWREPAAGEYRLEYRIRRASGEVGWIQDGGRFVADPGGKVVRADVISRDVTEIVLANERIRRLNRVHAVMSGINAATVRIGEEQGLLNESCRVAVEAGRFAMAWIGIVDDEASIVRPVAAHGAGAEDFLARAPLGLAENESGGASIVSLAVRTKEPVVVNDARNDSRPMMHDELLKLGINSLAILPLMASDGAVGILALYSADAGFFDDEELRLLYELAGDVSYALDHLEKVRKLDYLSYYDPLTGLPNRRLFHERLKLQLDDAARKSERVALQVLDVERFKSINDSLGRQVGDALLVDLARRVQQGALPTSWFARLEADHFAAVMPAVAGPEQMARRTQQRAGEVFGVPFEVGGSKLRVSARGGIAIFPDDATDADTLLRNAEAALKKAKATGERYLFYTQEMTARIAERLALENRLREALERDEFILHYQPKFEADGRTLAGLEALMRWQDPDGRQVPPAEFVPILEETGLILQAGAWVLRRAALDHRAWAEAGLAPPKVAVNVSALQLRQRDFIETVERSIAEGVSPTAIELEITETIVMEDIQATIDKLSAMRQLGIGIAIDDFGTGYSSLVYLARLPVEALKVDRSFVTAMMDDPATMSLIQTMISLAHSLKLKVIAEGVETEQQARILRLLRCDQLQGYLYSKPVPGEQIAAMLRSNLA